VFLAPIVTSEEISFKSNLPECKIKKTEIKSKVPCYGKIVYPSDVIYEGEFGKFNDIFERHGNGTMIYEDGRKFVGQWYMGKLHGMGTMIWKNGKRFDGNFNKGIFGIGIYKLRNILDVWDGIRFWYYRIIY